MNQEDENDEQIEYERLSEFFFDLCLSWCQHLDIETFIFFNLSPALPYMKSCQ
jgi:hypothetical protein